VLHNVTLKVSDLQRSGSFYDSVLAPLGWRRQMDSDGFISWGLIKSEFFISEGDSRPGFGQVSFPAKSIPAVKASYESGLENGGTSEDEPGSAPAYGPGNYAARLKDPDGYVIELCVAP
jgi:catechol 2,3-dioxygenase-like lactoylglutathione lyase family enzyme